NKMTQITKTPLVYIERGNNVDEITNGVVLGAVEDNLDKLIAQSNKHNSDEEGDLTFITNSSGILIAVGRVSPASPVTLSERFDTIIAVSVTCEGTASDVAYATPDADTVTFS